MHITIKREAGSVAFGFHADTDDEGVTLKECVVAACQFRRGVEIDPAAIAAQLAERGYVLDDAVERTDLDSGESTERLALVRTGEVH